MTYQENVLELARREMYGTLGETDPEQMLRDRGVWEAVSEEMALRSREDPSDMAQKIAAMLLKKPRGKA